MLCESRIVNPLLNSPHVRSAYLWPCLTMTHYTKSKPVYLGEFDQQNGMKQNEECETFCVTNYSQLKRLKNLNVNFSHISWTSNKLIFTVRPMIFLQRYFMVHFITSALKLNYERACRDYSVLPRTTQNALYRWWTSTLKCDSVIVRFY